MDSSAWIAYANRASSRHREVKRVLQERAGRLVTSNFVFDETVTFLVYAEHHQAALRLGEKLLDGSSVTLVRLTVEDERSAWNLLSARPDQIFSFTDCTSFALMRRLEISTAVSLDADFRREGFEVLP